MIAKKNDALHYVVVIITITIIQYLYIGYNVIRIILLILYYHVQFLFVNSVYIHKINKSPVQTSIFF